MEVQNYRANPVQEYCSTENVLHGTFHDELQNYDLLKIIILNLGTKKTSHKLLDLLHLLFMDLKLSDEKEKILRDEYDITLTHDMRKELTKMGNGINLSDAVIKAHRINITAISLKESITS